MDNANPSSGLIHSQQKNDYTPHTYQVDDNAVDVSFVGHPMDRPKDIRARSFFVQRRGEDPVDPKDEHVVFRVVLRCTKNCTPAEDDYECTIGKGVSADEEDEEEHMDEEDQLLPRERNKRQRPRRKCNVKMHVSPSPSATGPQTQNQNKMEVHADDLGHVHIFMQHTHGHVKDLRDLRPSHYIRQGIKELVTLHGHTTSQIKKG